jgi:hypothetical protein
MGGEAVAEITSNSTNIVSQSEMIPDASIGEVIQPINTVFANPDAPFNQYVNFFGYMNIGPLGPQFSTVGSETYNVYLPQLSPEYPPIHGFPTMFGSVSEYIKMFLAGLPVGSTALESVLSDEVVSRFLLMSVAELEKAMGVFIVPRVIKANATMRGFRFAQDFDRDVA